MTGEQCEKPSGKKVIGVSNKHPILERMVNLDVNQLSLLLKLVFQGCNPDRNKFFLRP